MIRLLMTNERAKLWHQRAELVRRISCVNQQIRVLAGEMGLSNREFRQFLLLVRRPKKGEVGL